MTGGRKTRVHFNVNGYIGASDYGHKGKAVLTAGSKKKKHEKKKNTF